MEEEERRIKEKMDFFLEEKIKVHIVAKNKFFYNGLLIEKRSDSVYVLDDIKKGYMHIFTSDIHDVSQYREVSE